MYSAQMKEQQKTMGCGYSMSKDVNNCPSNTSPLSGCSLTSNANNNNHKGITDTQPNSTNCNDNSIQTSKGPNLTINRNSKLLDLCNGNTPPQRKRKPKEATRNSVQKPNSSETQNDGLKTKTTENKLTLPKTVREITPSKESIDARLTPTKRNAFQFWASKVGHNSLSGEELQRKSIDNTYQKEGSDNLRPERNIDSVVPGQISKMATLREAVKPEFNMSVIKERRSRREMFSDSKQFLHIDRHVLEVSKQIPPAEGWAVPQLVHLITEESQTDLEKVRAVWIWLCHNIKYDVDGFFGSSEKVYQPADVLRLGRGVCSGYAALFKEMCRELGLTCQEVSGYSRGAGYKKGQSCQQQKSNHMWNTIKLDDEWHLLDACWGAGTLDLENKVFIPRYDDFFFLTDPQDFIETHWPDDPKWQLMQSTVSFDEFEERVFKTSEFFKLHLHIISPHASLLRTVQGEATVSLACENPTEFTYQLSRLCDNVPNIVNKAQGILTVYENRMSLRVIPPTEGLFDLMIFAKPTNAEGAFSWVCSYQIECPQSVCLEALPKNPFNFWGLHQTVNHFGIKGCNCGGDLITTDMGTVNLTFETSRPLLAMYELVHEDLDESLSKKCIVSQIEDDQFSCQVSCLLVGYYRVSVFVKNLNEEHLKNAANLLIHCSRPVNHNEMLPSGLSYHCGPGLLSKRTGLSNPSHSKPIINTKLGKCNITFHTNSDLEVTAVLSKDHLINNSFPMERYILLTHLDQKISVSVLLPESGLYKVGLFARRSDGTEFVHICDYVVRCFSDPRWLPFPRVYSAWKKGCTLLQPRSGVVQAESWVQLRLKIPEACQVIVMGPSKTELHFAKSKVWEGEVYTGAEGNLLKVAAKFSPHSKCMNVILSYEVSDIQKNSNGASG